MPCNAVSGSTARGECFTMKLTSEHRGGALRRSGVSADFAHVPSSVVRRVKQRTADNERIMPHPPHIVFAGGSKPGHLYPGLAVAAHLMERIPDATATFVGGGRVVDHHLIRTAGFGYARVPSQPEPQNALHAVRFVTDNVAGYWAARWYLKEKHVSAVVGLGGASSAATVKAAVSRGIPTVLLEQNVVPGRVTRWLARSAATVCAGFDETRSYFPSAVPLAVTGNPARPAFEQLYRQQPCAERQPGEKRLIVIGGAGGARSINEHMPQALARPARATRRLANSASVWRRATSGNRLALSRGRRRCAGGSVYR